MGCFTLNRLIRYLVLSFIITASWFSSAAAIISDTEKKLMKKVRSIAVHEGDREISVVISGDGEIPDYMTGTIAFPPRIVVDIFCESPSFESMSRAVSGSILKKIRVGHHPKSIRLVLDIDRSDIPSFSSATRRNKLIVTLSPDKYNGQMQGAPDQEMQTPQEERNLSDTSDIKDINYLREGVSDRLAYSGGKTFSEAREPSLKNRTDFDDGVQAPASLTRVDVEDGQDDTTIMLNAIYAYESQNGSETIRCLKHLIKTYPGGRYSEKAHFLLAKATEQLHSKKLASRFYEVKRYYEDAVYKYPQSIYIPDANVSIGNICFKVKNYSEAMGYYNFVIDKDDNKAATLKALMQKAKIFLLKRREKETLSLYKFVIDKYPGTPEEIEAKFEMVKIFFEMNNFKKSLNILTGLVKQLDNIYLYPEIFRYLGDNYYQLGNNIMAIKNLFKLYNLRPKGKESHLILARIADAYREEGLTKDATKFYQLVLEQYPNTEGALISMYRLAEQQEKGEIEVEKRKVAPDLVRVDKGINVPGKIYEDAIRNALEKDENSPLIQFALLKLSIIAKKGKHYEKSLNILKELLKKHPRTKLKKEIEHTLEEILLPLLKKNIKTKQHEKIINVYQAEKNLIDRLKSPEIFLTVGRAAIELGLKDMAVELFYRAEPILTDEQKPLDLLSYISQDLFDKKEYESAEKYLNILLDKPPSEKYTSHAYCLKGHILFEDRKYMRASEMFSYALEFNQKRCARSNILIQLAKALLPLKSTKKAYQAVQEADVLSRNCYGREAIIIAEIGDLYIQLGFPQKALSVIKFALVSEKDEKNVAQLKLVMARCYEALNKKQDYLAIYNEIAERNDSFWSDVAREKIEEIKFRSIVPNKK